MKWLKWFRRLSDDKFMEVKLTPLCISVMYSLLDFCVSLYTLLPHKIVNEIFLFCHCQSPHRFPLWNSSPVPSYPSDLAILCAQSMQTSASEWSLVSSYDFAQCKLSHSHLSFFCVTTYSVGPPFCRSVFLFQHFKSTSQNLTSTVISGPPQFRYFWADFLSTVGCKTALWEGTVLYCVLKC